MPTGFPTHAFQTHLTTQSPACLHHHPHPEHHLPVLILVNSPGSNPSGLILLLCLLSPPQSHSSKGPGEQGSLTLRGKMSPEVGKEAVNINKYSSLPMPGALSQGSLTA